MTVASRKRWQFTPEVRSSRWASVAPQTCSPSLAVRLRAGGSEETCGPWVGGVGDPRLRTKDQRGGSPGSGNVGEALMRPKSGAFKKYRIGIGVVNREASGCNPRRSLPCIERSLAAEPLAERR